MEKGCQGGRFYLGTQLNDALIESCLGLNSSANELRSMHLDAFQKKNEDGGLKLASLVSVSGPPP